VVSARIPHGVEIDLAGVTFMDCTGLGVLVAARQAVLRTGGHLRVTNPQPIVRSVLELTGLLGVLTAAFDQAPPAPAKPESAAQAGSTFTAVTEPARLLVAA
jgi:anti-anti-sigma regulatory factor